LGFQFSGTFESYGFRGLGISELLGFLEEAAAPGLPLPFEPELFLPPFRPNSFLQVCL
jgi:hypothetical protein